MEQQGTDWVIGFKNEYGKKVAQGQEEHFGKQIWGVTTKDNGEVDVIINNYIAKINA